LTPFINKVDVADFELINGPNPSLITNKYIRLFDGIDSNSIQVNLGTSYPSEGIFERKLELYDTNTTTPVLLAEIYLRSEITPEDERFLKLNLEKDKKGAITMCTILDAVEGRGIEKGITQGITQGETLKLIMLVQKKARKGDSITKIADDLVEDEIVISPIYKMVKEYPEDTEKDIYQRLN
jgi:hypothetical protein